LNEETIAYQSYTSRDIVMLDLDLKQKAKIDAHDKNSALGKANFEI